MSTPAGWYPDATQPGMQRYWNGTEWTEHRAPLGPSAPVTQAGPLGQPAPIAPYGQPVPVASPSGGKKRNPVLIGVLACVALGVIAAIGGALAGSSDPTAVKATESTTTTVEAPTTTEAVTTTTEKATTTTVKPTTTIPPTTKPPVTEPPTTAGPVESTSQSNAKEKAQEYLDYSAFSRSGLIQQLQYEGFSEADSTYGVDALNVDWNEQAVKKAKDYLDYDSFSHSGLVQQLEYEGFTPEQAEHGVSANGL